MREIVRSS